MYEVKIELSSIDYESLEKAMEVATEMATKLKAASLDSWVDKITIVND